MVLLSMSVHTSLSPVTGFRRLLKASPPPPPPKTSPPRAPIERLPTFIIHDIGRQSDLRDVLYLSLCSHRLSRVLAPVLYASVDLTTNRHCKNTLIALAKRPDLMQHVRRLVVRPNCVQWTDPGDEMDERLVATLVARMAGSLKALEMFEWDGMEMPGPELWAALRASCRNLKRIGTSIGEDPLDPSSPLWEFDDLRQFSLRVKCHTLDWIADGLPKPEKLPRRFWEMILERSPRLEELTISSPAPSPRMFDIRHITSGRWSRLHSITLGDHVLIASDKNKGKDKDKGRTSTSTNTSNEEQSRKDHAALMCFFLLHPGLRTIRLEHTPGSVFFPSAFNFELESDSMRAQAGGARARTHALPNVEEFAGPITWVRTLPMKQRLRRLRVVGMHHSYYGYGYADSGVAKTCRVLAGLKWLEELSVWIDLSFGGGAGGFGGGGVGTASAGAGGGGSGRRASISGEREVGWCEDVNMEVVNNFLASRPGLKHLEVACFTRPSFSIKEFSATIRRSAPTLESFTLTKVHKSGDEEERELTRLAATRIAIENPGLRRFVLRTTVDPWFSPGFGFGRSAIGGGGIGLDGGNAGGRVRQLGVYEVLEAFDVLPYSVGFGHDSPFEDAQEEEDGGDLNAAPSQRARIPVQMTTATALFVREWGQKSKTTPTRMIMDSLSPGSSGGGRDHSLRCYVHPLNLSSGPQDFSSMPAPVPVNLKSGAGVSSSSRSGLGSSPSSAPSSASGSGSGCGSASSPPSSPTITTHGNHFPPSSWHMHMSTGNKNKRHSHSRSLSNGNGRMSPLSFSLTRSRSPSPSPSLSPSRSRLGVQNVQNVGWRPRRASCSSVPGVGVGSFGAVWEGVVNENGRARGVVSNRSSFCSSSEGAGSGSGCVPMGSLSGCGGGQVQVQGQGYKQMQSQSQIEHLPQSQTQQHQQGQNPVQQSQVTWAQSVENRSSLGRSGSSSTGGSAGSVYGGSFGCNGGSAGPQSQSQSQRLGSKCLGLRWGIGKGRKAGKYKDRDRNGEEDEADGEEGMIEEGYVLI